MDRTLFTPPMIETFRVCRRAYQLAFLSGREASKERIRLSSMSKRFVLRALAEINRSRLHNIPQVQKYIGQHWPTEKLSAENDIDAQERSIQAFRMVYRVLTNYVAAPYRPAGSEVAAVALKVRARVPHTKSYLEDTLDLVLWHPEKKQLEIVDFHLHPHKPFDPAWPSSSLLIRHFLAQRLRARWPFERLVMTFCRLQSDGLSPMTVELDESVVRLHWPELLKTINQMKSEEEFEPHRSDMCNRCEFLSECLAMGQHKPGDQSDSVCMSA